MPCCVAAGLIQGLTGVGVGALGTSKRKPTSDSAELIGTRGTVLYGDCVILISHLPLFQS